MHEIITLIIHRGPKNKTPNYCPHLRQILTDFQNYFTGTLSSKFLIKWSLKIFFTTPVMCRYSTLRNIYARKRTIISKKHLSL